MPRKTLDQDLQLIRDELVILSSMVEKATLDTVTALRDLDMEKSAGVYQGDQEINAKRFDMEGQIIVTLATQQPVTRDLRFLASALGICSELERMGDYAKVISIINLRSQGMSMPTLLAQTYAMGEQAVERLHRSMSAFVTSDVETSRRIILEDDLFDEMYNQLYFGLMSIVIDNPSSIERVNYLLWAAHNLERSADRATNICERTIYVATGEIADLEAVSNR